MSKREKTHLWLRIGEGYGPLVVFVGHPGPRLEANHAPAPLKIFVRCLQLCARLLRLQVAWVLGFVVVTILAAVVVLLPWFKPTTSSWKFVMYLRHYPQNLLFASKFSASQSFTNYSLQTIRLPY